MNKLRKIITGVYYFENNNNEVVYIYKIDRGCWGYCIMEENIGTFKSLQDARNKLMWKSETSTFKSLREARYKLMYKSEMR